MQPRDSETRAKLSDARAQMLLDPAVAYLNCGAFGPLSRQAADSVAAWRSRLAQEPMDFQLRQAPSLLWTARTRLANFLGGDARRLMFANNVTEAVNLVASSVALATPGEILVSDHEYPTMRWCWERAAQRRGMALRALHLPLAAHSPEQLVDAALAALTPRTRLLFISHIVSATGLIVPVRAICAAARRRGIVTVIDGAHAPGFTRLDLAELDCDYYIGSAHKWLLAPTGTGFLHAGVGALERLEPPNVSWGYHLPVDGDAANARDQFGATPALRRLECTGTRDICAWLTIPAALDFIERYGQRATAQRMRELSTYARARLSALPGLLAATPAHPELSAAMTAYALPAGTDPGALQARLWQRFRVEVGMTQAGTTAMLRVSTHFFNTEADIDQLAQALTVSLNA